MSIIYDKPSEPGFYCLKLLETQGVVEVVSHDDKLWISFPSVKNSIEINYATATGDLTWGPRVPEDWKECWDLGRAQELRKQAEAKAEEIRGWWLEAEAKLKNYESLLRSAAHEIWEHNNESSYWTGLNFVNEIRQALGMEMIDVSNYTKKALESSYYQ